VRAPARTSHQPAPAARAGVSVSASAEHLKRFTASDVAVKNLNHSAKEFMDAACARR
jgi:hypothetical protein